MRTKDTAHCATYHEWLEEQLRKGWQLDDTATLALRADLLSDESPAG